MRSLMDGDTAPSAECAKPTTGPQTNLVPNHFTRFAAIDWSGAKGARHPGIALAICDEGRTAPLLVEPPRGVWSRTDILHWLHDRADVSLLVGFDFSFSAPFLDRGAYLPGETDATDPRALWAMSTGTAAMPILARRPSWRRGAGGISIWARRTA
jgi:hypothetical protein